MIAEIQTYADSSTIVASQRHADPSTHASHLTSVDNLQRVGSPTGAYPPALVEYLEGAKSLVNEDSLPGAGFLKDVGFRTGVARNQAKCIAIPDLQIGPPAAYWAVVLVLEVTCLVPLLLVVVLSGGSVQCHTF